MNIGRLLRHATTAHWRTRMLFPAATLDAIERAIAAAEQWHAGEIRFAIETALTPKHILNDVTPRAQALEVFSRLRVWDTEANNGVLIYVQLADRIVEIIADRGFQGRVPGSRRSATYWPGIFRRTAPKRRIRAINCLIARLCCR
jgi:uncharacterized membrane protein